MQTITSNQNPIIKEVKSLKIRKNREEKELYFIEGIRFVQEALDNSVDIEKILISDRLYENKGGEEIRERIRSGNFDIYHMTDKLFQEVSDTESPQGILAVVRSRRLQLEEVIKKGSFFLVLDSLQDPGNMGTVIRTADASAVDGIIISRGCVDLYNPKVLRATMGSVFHVPVCYCDNLIEAIDILKNKGIRVLAAHLKGESYYFNTDMRENICVIIGNEANGISEEVAQKADMLVKIPMPGKSESLNASVAASLLMYEVVRQRMRE